MRKIATIGFVSLCLVVSSSWAQEVVLPGFAWHHPGASGNRWSSEVYVTNTGSKDVNLTVGAPIIGRMVQNHPCLPPIRQFTVPPMSTARIPAITLAASLGCPDEFVGGLILNADGAVLVNTRMTNDRSVDGTTPDAIVQGFGEEIPGVAWADLPHEGVTYMLPGLIWQPNPPICGAPRFDTAVAYANPNAFDVTVTFLDLPSGPLDATLNGKPVRTPFTITVGAMRWVQVQIGPPQVAGEVCGAPEVFDLFFQVTGPIGCFASVVDRTTQDPRTVMPVPVE
jgi:hypothetical protein